MCGRLWLSISISLLFLWISEFPAARCCATELQEQTLCRLETRLGHSERNFRFEDCAFAFFADSKNFLVLEESGFSCDVEVWKVDVDQFERVKRISKVSPIPLIAICASRKNGFFFCLDWGGNVFRVSISDGKSEPIAVVEGAESIAASPRDDVIAVSGVHSRIHLFDAGTGNPLWTTEKKLKDRRGETCDVTHLQFSRDGQFVIGGRLSNQSYGPCLGIWRSDNAANVGHISRVSGHGFRQLLLSADGKRFVTMKVIDDEPLAAEIHVRSAVNGDWLQTIDPTQPPYAHIGQDLAPEERTFRTCWRDRITSWDIETGKKLREVKLAAIDAHTNPQVISPDGRFVIGMSGKRLQAWNAETGAVIGPVLPGHRGPVCDAQLIDQGRVVLAVSNDGAIYRWDRATGRELSHVVDPLLRFSGFACDSLKQGFVLSQSPVWSAGESESWRFIDLRETTTLDVVRQFDIGAGPVVTKVAMSPNGKLVAACFRHSVAVWDKSTGEKRHNFGLTGRQAAFQAMSFSADSSRVYVASSEGKCLMFDLTNNQQLDGFSIWEHVVRDDGYTPDKVNFSRTFSAAVNDNGTSLAVGFGRWLGVYDLESGQLRSKIQTNADIDRPYFMALSNDAQQLVTAEMQFNECITTDEVILWDITSSKKLTSWSTPNARPIGIRFAESEELLVLGMDNGTIELRSLPKKP